MKIRNLVLATSVALLPLGAMAQTITQRQYNEQARIRQGVRSGELTRHETRSLERGQRQIQREKMAARSDGYVSGRERAQIRHDERVQSRRIYNQKHDGQRY